MQISRAEVIGIAAAIVVALAGGLGAGAVAYNYGRDTREAEVRELTSRYDQLLSLTQNVDLLTFLQQLETVAARISQDVEALEAVGQLQEVSQVISSDLEKVSSQLAESQKDLENLRASAEHEIASLRAENSELRSLLSKDFSSLKDFTLTVGNSEWLIPGKLATGLTLYRPNALYD